MGPEQAFCQPHPGDYPAGTQGPGESLGRAQTSASYQR
jgi:hypothetical protein